VTFRVEAGDHDHLPLDHAVEHSVRKPPEQHAAGITVDDWGRQGMYDDRVDGGPECLEELIAEALAPLFVPPIRILDISGCRRP
jgi:hypothetical protein